MEKWVRLPPAYLLETIRAERQLKHKESWRNAGGEMPRELSLLGGCLFERLQGGDWIMEKWVVEEVLRWGGVAVLAGESNVGKTWVSLDLALSISLGGKWLNKLECDQGPVIYFSGESSYSMLDRRLVSLLLGREIDLKRWRGGDSKLLTLVAPSDLKMYNGTPILNNPRFQTRIFDLLERLPKELRPRLWVFDPLTNLCDMDQLGAVLTFTRQLAEASNALVLLLHHFRKSKGRDETSLSDRIRGDNTLRNLSDEIILLTRDDHDPTFTNLWKAKSRDSECPGETIPFCGIVRNSNELSPAEFYEVMELTGVAKEVVEKADPRSLSRMKLIYANPRCEPILGEPSPPETPARETRPGITGKDLLPGQPEDQQWRAETIYSFLEENGPQNRTAIMAHLKELRPDLPHGAERLKTLFSNLVGQGFLSVKGRSRGKRYSVSG